MTPPPARSLRGDLLELLSSMRFAISLLTVICVASAIGTVVRQGEPATNYVEQFGPFWAEVYGALGLYRIYSSPWFLLILAFLVTSTSLCIARNAPRILVDFRNHKEGIREQALNAFHHRAEGTLATPLAESQARVQQLLSSTGWSIKSQVRTGGAGKAAGVMIAARLGAVNKLGYIAAHSAIVLVCVGGLFDGDLIVKVQAWAQNLQPFRGGAVTEQSRLSVGNPAYRAQLFVAEGQRSNSAVLNLDKGMLLQPLPFEVELKKFNVDYYATGMPKRFASDIVIHDPRTNTTKAATVEVNHPVVYDGVTIFQSSFEDGGSQVSLKPVFLRGEGLGTQPELIHGVVNGDALPLATDAQGQVKIEITGLRVINVENLSDASGGEDKTDVRGVNLADLSKHLGSGAKPPGDKKLVNVGPSVTYKLRDAAGQAREYQNYMVPVNLNGQAMFLLGVRDTPSDNFRFLRVPADENNSLDGWLRLRRALGDETMRREAVRRFAVHGAPPERPELAAQLAVSAQRALDLFAGAIVAPRAPGEPASTQPPGGLQALSDFIEQVVPAPERERTSETLVRILNGALAELMNLSREKAGLSPLSMEAESARAFMTQSVLSISDAFLYPVPVVLMLDGFEQRQASVFQVTRTPGRNVVYLGCVLLIVGVFAMLYIRERRLWIWLHSGDAGGGTQVRMALSATRHTLDTDAEFERLKTAVLTPAARV
ncbi:cytochrome c biogenesis protein ResB [Aquabacterium sp. CECT 9606]|uniref:cytochrome c biogenesis protein ResB n=1 Tax=Aquabacterium sp. CECT 9606 TaxID=2845822 RepID=UPI001E562F99|nr:cytochrome c biogenesis protein ResB [Aquabacterium sp. CECT 9606]CAH0347800.1 Cytochrome c biogenesis protein Ccs1 [Aquabacterium sp. CECT 9606]